MSARYGYRIPAPRKCFVLLVKESGKNLFLLLLPFTDHVYYIYFYTIYNK